MSNTNNNLPTDIAELKAMGFKALRDAHNQGQCPKLEDLVGLADGCILHPPRAEKVRLWRGKVFKRSDDGKITGLNRWGVGPMNFQRYQFEARIDQSAFSDRKVVLLDHDWPENPNWARKFHDEMVEMRPGLYLACSHLKRNGKLEYLSYFAFEFPSN